MSFKLNHLHLKTRDPDQTARFYTDVLGARLTSKNANGGYRMDLHGLSLNVTDWSATQHREQKLGMEHIALDTDEYDVLVARLKARGVNILEETTVAGKRRACFFEGPDGVQLEFIEMKS